MPANTYFQWGRAIDENTFFVTGYKEVGATRIGYISSTLASPVTCSTTHSIPAYAFPTSLTNFGSAYVKRTISNDFAAISTLDIVQGNMIALSLLLTTSAYEQEPECLEPIEFVAAIPN